MPKGDFSVIIKLGAHLRNLLDKVVFSEQMEGIKLCPRGVMDNIFVFETKDGGSNPPEGTAALLKGVGVSPAKDTKIAFWAI